MDLFGRNLNFYVLFRLCILCVICIVLIERLKLCVVNGDDKVIMIIFSVS